MSGFRFRNRDRVRNDIIRVGLATVGVGMAIARMGWRYSEWVMITRGLFAFC